VKSFTAPTHITTDHLQQGDKIINLAPLEEEQAPETSFQVGLRVQNITLAQDAGEAQLRREAQQSINTILFYLNSTPVTDDRSHNHPVSITDFFR
jgi:hypothetical protein